MEPPAKRMRILQAIGVEEVDENDPEYIKKQSEGQERLKSRFEAIFAKYEAMPDMMSDELDMRNGSIAVDRGHMKKLDKQYRSRLGLRTAMPLDDTQLADDMFANDPEMGADNDTESEFDERDELAPSPSPEPAMRKNALPDGSVQNPQMPSTAQSDRQIDIAAPNTPANATLQPTFAAPTNPAADLMQLVQFPQTPAGQEAQRAFVAHTAQAVQQAVTSIFSRLLSTVPSLQQQPNLLQTPATSTVDPNTLVPFTAPTVHYPPPSASSDQSTAAQSSPMSLVQTKPRKRRSFAVGVHITPKRHSRIQTHVPLSVENGTAHTAQELEQATETAGDCLTVDVEQSLAQSPTGRPQERRGRSTRYKFTAEDDQYIIESRVLHRLSWDEIINSRGQWRVWPKRVFHYRWKRHLKPKAVEFQSLQMGAQNATQGADETVSIESGPPALNEQNTQILSSPTAARHLPTPSSLQHEEEKHYEEHMAGEVATIMASGGHYDGGERDLLSLGRGEDPAGDVQADAVDDVEGDTADAQVIPETPPETARRDSFADVPDYTTSQENRVDSGDAAAPPEPVAAGADNLELQNTIPSQSSRQTSLVDTTHHTPPQKTNVLPPSPSAQKHPQPPTLPPPQVPSSDSEDDLNLIAADPHPTRGLPQCPLCKQTFATIALLQRHETQPHPREIHVRPRSRPASPLPRASAVAALPAPETPAVKRESVEPPLDLLPAPAAKTPVSAPPRTGGHSSGGKGASKMSRSVYNRVKRSWAARTTPAPKGGVRSRRSFQFTPARRRVDELLDGDMSEDELAR